MHLAITGLLEEEPDMVVSGINAGANMGDDVLYSGNVGGGHGGAFSCPAGDSPFRMNSHNPDHYATGARVARELVERLLQRPLPF